MKLAGKINKQIPNQNSTNSLFISQILERSDFESVPPINHNLY